MQGDQEWAQKEWCSKMMNRNNRFKHSWESVAKEATIYETGWHYRRKVAKIEKNSAYVLVKRWALKHAARNCISVKRSKKSSALPLLFLLKTFHSPRTSQIHRVYPQLAIRARRVTLYCTTRRKAGAQSFESGRAEKKLCVLAWRIRVLKLSKTIIRIKWDHRKKAQKRQ